MKIIIIALLNFILLGSTLAQTSYGDQCRATLLTRFERVPSDMLIYCSRIKNEHQYSCLNTLAYGYQSMPSDWVLHCANCKTQHCAEVIATVPGLYKTLTTTQLAIIISRAMNEN